MTQEQAQAALGIIDQIKAHPDFASRTDLHEEVSQIESALRAQVPSENGSHERNLQRAREEGVAAEQNYATAAHPYQTAAHAVDRAALHGDQELIATPSSSHARNLAQAGAESAEAAKNYEFANRTAGNKVYSSMAKDQLAGALASATNQIPGASHLVESTGDVVQALTGHRPLPMSGDYEQVIENAPSPTLANAMGGLALPAGTVAGGPIGRFSRAAMAPISRTYEALSPVANRLPGQVLPRLAAGAGSAATVAGLSGDDVPSAAISGAAGVLPEAVAASAVNPNTARGRTAARYASAQASGTAERVAQERAQAQGRGIEYDPSKAAKVAEDATIGEAGRGLETEFRARTNELRGQSKEARDKGEKDIAALGQTYNMLPFHNAVEDIVRKYERVPYEEGGGFSAPDEPIRMKLGESVAGVRDILGRYLQRDATFPDIMNAIKELHTYGNSGEPSKQLPYRQIEGELRTFAKKNVPGYSEMSERYAKEASARERANSMVYGKTSEEENLGAGRGKERFGPEGGEIPSIPPQSEATGGKFLMGEGPGLQSKDYEQLRSMDPRYADILDEASAVKNKATAETGERNAIQDSRWPGIRDLGVPAAIAGVAALHPSPYRAAEAALAIGLATPKMLQPLQSRLAAHLSPEDARAFTPNLLALALANSRKKDFSQQLVQDARNHGQRLTASLADMIQARQQSQNR